MVYNQSMPGSKKKKTGKQIEVILVDKNSSQELPEGGICIEEEDVKIICHALAAYTPTRDEEHLHSVLLEEFEHILAVDYNEFPDDQ